MGFTPPRKEWQCLICFAYLLPDDLIDHYKTAHRQELTDG